MVAIILILFVIFYALPLPLKIILTIINNFVPDGIPVIDELLMGAATVGHIMKIIKVSEFAEMHPVWTKIIITLIILLILGAIVFGVIYFFK